MMRYRKFGNTDLTVSEIGFGAWAIGGGAMIGNTSIGWGDVDDVVSKQAIHAALDAGINFFDTADIYGLGHSEEMIGKTIGNNRSVVVATKVGNVAKGDQFTIDYSTAHILDACDQSLKRLKRERIDYYQLHSARMNQLQANECIDAMNQLVGRGKVRYWGLSLNTFDPMPEADYLLQNNFGNGFQLVLNILNHRALPLFSRAYNKGFGIIARMPLQFGLLTGKFDANASFAINDHRRGRLTREVILTSTEVLHPVWELCNKYHMTKAELALSYVLSYPEISTVIPGIRTPEHVAQNTNNLQVLDDEDVKMIEDLGKSKFLSLMELIQRQG